MNNDSFKQSRYFTLCHVAAVACVCFLGWATWVHGRDGFSSFLLRSSPADASRLQVLNRAIQLSAFKSRPYDTRGKYLIETGDYAGAERDFQEAIVRSPHNYLLWLRLGYAREEKGDRQGAISAYSESIRLAPSFSMPHWYLGTLLLEMKRLDEAFSELRRAATAEPELLPLVIDFAWTEFNGEPAAVRRALQPQSQAEHFTLAARFFDDGKLSEGIALYRDAGALTDTRQKALIATLIELKAYPEAYEFWAKGRGMSTNAEAAGLTNGGFETDIDPTARGFEWQVNDVDNVRVMRDPREPESGAHSLRIDFDGHSSPSSNIVSQILLVQPLTNYEVAFAARNQELVTGGLPAVVIVDASDGRFLGQARVIRDRTTGWQRYSFQFSTLENTRAVVMAIKRETCGSGPCPIFGHTWFDSFSVRRL